jgi:hypothetical protein
MNASKRQRFYFHADANALGGVITQPTQTILPSSTSVSLAQAGGFGVSRAEKIRVDGVLSCGEAAVSVFGGYDAGHDGWRTLVTVSVDDLNILHAFTADRIVAQLSVVHAAAGGLPKVSLVGSQYVNLKIAGVQVEPTLHLGAFGRTSDDERGDVMPTYEDFLDIADEQHQSVLERPEPAWLGGRLAATEPRRDLVEKGSALCSLVQSVAVKAPATSYMHVIHLPDFGNIYLGELLINRSCYQLTMARIELGCIATGDVSVGCGFSNGRPMP